MTNGATTQDEDLPARISALEAENARLREAVAPVHGRGAGRWRAWLSALCIVVASVLVPVSVVTAWGRAQLVDEDAFVATLAPLAADPAVQSMIIDETMDAITAQVDFTAITSSAIDGIADLGLPPAAVSALTLLKQPAADGLESLVERAVTRVVTSDAFAEVWATTTRAGHRAFTTAATSDGGGLVVRTDDGVGVQLGAIVERVTQTLTAQGVGIAGLIPRVDRVVILGSGESLAQVRTGYAVAAGVGYWAPVLTLGLLVGGILIARRRQTALLGAGLGLLIGGGVLAIVISIGSALMAAVGAQTGLEPAALAAIYAQVSDGMARTSVVLALIGAAVAAVAWVHGRSRPAVALRSTFGSINRSLRRARTARGLETGAVGRWLYAQRVLVRALIVALAVAGLLVLRPLTVSAVILVGVLALFAWWIAELLQARPDEAITATEESAAPVSL
ncbi:MAG: hypothetical protein J0I43_13025 [Microbacterium sp.]|uniref:hypothetical protein n=1 Tax=Microbacterium sp. TaxID=51671 RepID=UPI001AD0A7CE|nr:hypothetical protein [Microbacterium sp.]MBN9178272.1 hypothetical protein [Microbacterium sp.]